MNPLFWTSGKEGSYYDSRASFLTGDISDSGLSRNNVIQFPAFLNLLIAQKPAFGCESITAYIRTRRVPVPQHRTRTAPGNPY